MQNERARQEQEKEAAYYAHQEAVARRAEELEAEQAAQRRARQRELLENQQRLIQQKRAMREAERRRRAQPDNPQDGCLSLAGEDHGKAEREALQAKQQRHWIARQLRDRHAREEETARREREYAQYVSRATEAADAMDQQMRQDRDAYAAQLRDANFRAAEERELRLRRERQLEEQLSQMHAETVANDPMMTEDPAATVRGDDPSRPMPDRFKGFSREQNQRILDTQMRQIEEHRRQKEEERDEEARWLTHQQIVQRQLRKAQRQAAEERARMREENLHTNLRLMEEKKRRDRRLREAYSNEVDDSFWSQFGTSAR